MRVAIDGRELARRRTGVGRYLTELLTAWADSADARRHEWRLYVPSPLDQSYAIARIAVIDGRSAGTLWEQWTFARALAADRPDLVFAPAYTAPLSAPCPIALTLHDVSFFAHPEWFAPRERLRRRFLTRWSVRRAGVVLTDSKFSRDEIIRRLGVPANRIRVIPLGVSQKHRDARAVDREPLILFVGSLFRRRHVDKLIRAFAELVAPQVTTSRLVIVGENRIRPPTDFGDQIRALPAEIARRVTFRSYVDEHSLQALYRQAMVFAFPSEYEGFGLTPLEALNAGVPPVVLDTPIAREVYGPAAIYVDSDGSGPNIVKLGEALVRLLRDPSAHAAVMCRADEVLARYDWRRTAAATLRALEEAVGAQTSPNTT